MNDVLRRVQGFYEQHPYPEPATDLDDYRDGRMIPRGRMSQHRPRNRLSS